MAIAKVFFDADLRYGIDGLKAELKRKRIAVSAMRGTDYMLFLNRKRNQCKLISFNERGAYLTTFKTLKGRMHLEDLKMLPNLYTKTNFVNTQMATQVEDFLGHGVQVYTEGEALKIG